MPDIYGSDSGQDGWPQNSCASASNQFYIGRLGRNLSPDDPNNPAYFNRTLAQNIINAGSQDMKVYGYWFVYGPDVSERGTRTPYEYGRAQANAAIEAYHDFKDKGLLNGITIFADIERENDVRYGWSESDYAANREVINGFLSRERHGNNPVYIGVYSNPCKWEQIAGSVSWTPSLPYNWSGSAWTSSYNWGNTDPGCIDGNWDNWQPNAPCAGADPYVARGFGSFAPVIWQYAIDTPLDHDIAWTLPD